MSTPPTPAKANEPLVTDEWIDDRFDEYKLAYRTQITIVVKEVRELYEQDRTKLLADLAAMREAGDKMRNRIGNCGCDESEYSVGRCKKCQSCIDAWDALTPPRNG